MGFHRLIGVLLTIGGLWHVASPWLARYSDVRAAVISSIVSGVALAVVGIIFIAVRGSAWLCWVGGAIGVWVLFAPHVLGYADRGLAANEAVWGGLFTIVLVGISGIERWLGRVRPPVRPAGQW